MKLFVYGTLLPGMRLHNVLSGGLRLGPALVRGTLLDLGSYAGLVQGDGRVTGEIYEVDDRLLERLDQVEGFHHGDPAGSLYVREGVQARLFADGATVEAAAYIFNRAVGTEEPIACGDFRRCEAEKDGGPVWVIAYGSNLSSERICVRLKGLGPRLQADRDANLRVGCLEGFRLTFNKWSKDRNHARANIEFVGGDVLCPVAAWLQTLDECGSLDVEEGAVSKTSPDYRRIGLPLVTRDGTMSAEVYLADPARLCAPEVPEDCYLDHIRTGYKEHGFDEQSLTDAVRRAASGKTMQG